MDTSDLLARVNIVDYVGQYCDLVKKGGEYWACSPFSESDSTPSFSVSEEKQMFYDFSGTSLSSGKRGGNIIDFIMAYHRCSMKEAFAILEAYLGMEPGESTAGQLEAVKVAKKFRRKTHSSEHMTTKYLPENVMDRYEKNLARLSVWNDEGISFQSMEKFSVRYDPFSNRIVFPIRSYDGKIIAVKGRTCDPKYKEKGVRKYTYFQNIGCLDTLYGFFENESEVRRLGSILLFEGEKSVMHCDTWNIHNAAAILTSHLNHDQARFLIRLGVRVVFCLDSDVDIRKDPEIKFLCNYVPVEAIVDSEHLLGEKMAPVDAGIETFERLYAKRIHLN